MYPITVLVLGLVAFGLFRYLFAPPDSDDEKNVEVVMSFGSRDGARPCPLSQCFRSVLSHCVFQLPYVLLMF